MKKIGILTFHRSYNYGAFMQCYALSKKLSQDFENAVVEVVDYATENVYNNYSVSVKDFIFGREGKKYTFLQSIKQVAKLFLDPFRITKEKKLHKCFDEELEVLPLSEKKLISNSIQEFNTIFQNEYDVIIVGSDCVWEFIDYDFPNAYFLSNIHGAVKMSYAASSDRMHIDNITEEQKKEINEALSDFALISIRDIATENFLKGINKNFAMLHCGDPTLLLDIKSLAYVKEELRKKLVNKGIDLNKPIIGFMCEDRVVKIVKKRFGRAYQYVALYNNCSLADVYLYDLKPLEWAVVFSFFKITFTRFFHGFLLSTKNETPTITIDDWPSQNIEHITKLEDVHSRLEIKEQLVKRKEFLFNKNEQERILSLAEKMMREYDFSKINQKICEENEGYNVFKEFLVKQLV